MVRLVTPLAFLRIGQLSLGFRKEMTLMGKIKTTLSLKQALKEAKKTKMAQRKKSLMVRDLAR